MGKPIIDVKKLTKQYGDVTAVDHLTLSVEEGEVFGLLGPNGAGKTTTTLMLLGLTEPTQGKAFIAGHDCTREPIAVKQLVGYLPDNVGFYPDLTGRQNLRFTGKLNGLSDEECENRIATLLKRVGLDAAADRRAGTYSRGMRQRLGIADVLMKEPKVIIMDEPTLGIDPEGVQELIGLIRRLSVEDGRTILISSHQLYQIQQICDRVGIFVKGRLIACGPIRELGKQLQNRGLYILEVKAEPMDKRLMEMLGTLPYVKKLHQDADDMISIESSQDIRRQLTYMLAENGYDLALLRQRGGDLDEIYKKFFEKAGEQNDSVQSGSKAKGLLRFKKQKQQ